MAQPDPRQVEQLEQLLKDDYEKQVSLAWSFGAAEPEDAVQQASVQALMALARGSSPDALAPWFSKILQNVVVSEYRRRTAAVRGGGRTNVSLEEATAVSVQADSPQQLDVREALKSLSDLESELLRLRFFHAMTLTEVSRRAHRSVSTVKRVIAQALRKLKPKLRSLVAGPTKLLQLLEMIESSSSIEAALDVLRRTTAPAGLERAALMRRFDRGALDVALRVAAPDSRHDVSASIRALTGHSDVDRVGDSETYRVRRHEQERLVNEWKVHRSSDESLVGEQAGVFRAIHSSMAEHFDARGEEWQLESLHHRLISDPHVATEQVRRLIEECLPQLQGETLRVSTHPTALRGLAIGRAFDVLAVAEEQQAFLPTRCREELVELRRVVDAWSYWAVVWRRCHRYVKRSAVETLLREFVDSWPERRIVELYAPGGTGKTMSIAWLLARYCLPRGIPAAHLDFESFLRKRIQEPWQLVAKIVEQVHRQLAGSPLHSLIKEAERLATASDVDRSDSSTAPGGSVEQRTRELVARFAGALDRYQAADRFVVVIDTFEQAMLRGAARIGGFMDVLVHLVDACKKVRVVICGRYSITDTTAKLSARLDVPERITASVQAKKLPLLDRRETEEFLETRGLEVHAASIDRLFERRLRQGAEGVVPFDLALGVDIARGAAGDAGITVDEVLDNLAKVDLIHLIVRVIDQIVDPVVRLVVRYGVAPRQLSRDFVDQVIYPYIERRKQGLGDDDPKDDLAGKLPTSFQDPERYDLPADTPLPSSDELWHKLCDYASASSWVEPVPMADDLLRLNERVREPMRELLRDKAIDREVHAAAAAFFERVAEAAKLDGRADRHQDALREYFYHSFQLAGPEVLREWADALERALVEENLGLAAALAEEITSEEYTDGPKGGRPRKWREDIDIVTPAALFRAYVTVAMCSLDLHYDAANRKQRKELLADASVAQSKARATAKTNADRHTVKALKAELDVLRGQVGKPTITALQAAVERADEHNERWRTALARCYLHNSHPRCVQLFAELVRDRIDSKKIDSPITRRLCAEFALALTRFGGTESQFTGYSVAVQVLLEETSGAVQEMVIVPTARLLSAMGRPSRALALLGREGAGVSAIRFFEQQSSQLELMRPARVLDRVRSIDTTEFQSSELGDLHLLEAQACAQLCERDAEEAFEAAFRAFQHGDRAARTAEVLLRKAVYEVVYARDFKSAQRTIESFRRSVFGKETSRRVLVLEVLEFAIASVRPRFKLARRLQRVQKTLEVTPEVRDRVRAVTILLAFLSREHAAEIGAALLDDLVADLSRLSGPAARASVLSGLRFCETVPFRDADRERVLRITRLLNDGADPVVFGFESETLTSDEDMLTELARAHWLRVGGFEDEAREIAHRLKERAFSSRPYIEPHGPAIARELVQLLGLLGEVDTDVVAQLAAEVMEEHAPLALAIAVEHAEHALRSGETDGVGPLLTTVARSLPALLDDGPLLPSLRARCMRVAARFFDPDGAAGMAAIFKGATSVVLESLAARNLKSLGDERVADLPNDKVTPRRSPDGFVMTPSVHVTLGRKQYRSVLRRLEIATQTSDPAPARLTEAFLSDANRLATALGREVLEPARNIDAPRDIALVTELDAEHLPWELAFRLSGTPLVRSCYRTAKRAESERERARWLQSALARLGAPGLIADGYWGDVSRRTLEEFKVEVGVTEDLRRTVHERVWRTRRQRRVFIVQPDQEYLHSSKRSVDFGGHDLVKLWSAGDWHVEVVEGMDLQLFLSEVSSDPPLLVHVFAPYIHDPSTGYVGPFLAGRYQKAMAIDPDRFGTPPFVILDGPAETDPFEQARQIQFRNAFAANLFAENAASAVLTAGLDDVPDISRYEGLCSQLSRGTFRDFLSAAQGPDYPFTGAPQSAELTLDPLDLVRYPSRLISALWTHDPDLFPIP